MDRGGGRGVTTVQRPLGPPGPARCLAGVGRPAESTDAAPVPSVWGRQCVLQGPPVP